MASGSARCEWLDCNELLLKPLRVLLWVPPRKRTVSFYIVVFQINQPTRCNNFSSLSDDVYVQLNMFRAVSRPSSGAQQLQYQPLVLPLERGGSSAGRPDHDQQHCYHHAPTVKPEADTSVVELLLMGVRMPETCWAVHTTKRQIINLRNCCICICLVDLFQTHADAQNCEL
jgi:hypothetical protein